MLACGGNVCHDCIHFVPDRIDFYIVSWIFGPPDRIDPLILNRIVPFFDLLGRHERKHQ